VIHTATLRCVSGTRTKVLEPGRAFAQAAGRELTDDREELVRLVERVMHLTAGSTQEEDDAVVMELQRRVPRAAVTDLISIPSGQRPASSSGSAEGMSRGSA
jgi:hypothetical protein